LAGGTGEISPVGRGPASAGRGIYFYLRFSKKCGP
jgi:hypothetical protein